MNINRVLLTVTLASVIGILGCTSPLKSEDPATRARAVAELSTDKELFFVAMNIGVYIGQQNGSYHNVFFTQEQYPDDVRVAAVERLKNMDYLLMCASWNDGDVYVDPGEGRLEYCGANYYFQGKEDLRIPVLPGNVVKTAAIKRLSDFATFKEASKSLNTKAKGRLLPKPSSTMQRGSSSDGNAFIDHNGHIRPGNPLDKALCTALEKLKQPDAAADFLYNAAEGGQGIASESFGYAMKQLEGVSSKVVYSILQKIFKEHLNMYTKNEWLPMLIRYIDYPEAEQVLTAHNDNGDLFVANADQRVMLLKKLPENRMVELALDGIKKEVTKYNAGDWETNGNWNFETAILVAGCVKNSNAKVHIVSTVLSQLYEIKKANSNTLMLSWTEKEESRMTQLCKQLPQLTEGEIGLALCRSRNGWPLLIDSVSPAVAKRVLAEKKANYEGLEIALSEKILSEDIDLPLYHAVRSDKARKLLVAKMSESVKKELESVSTKTFTTIMEKAKAAAKETFELHGFYLGMEWEDMKQVLSHHFPDYTITERRDGDEKDADYVVYIPKQSTPFCYASAKDKEVYQFNFGKVVLKKWYKYDAQAFGEWARSYSRENKIDMKYKLLEKDTEVYEMDMSRSYKVWFHQETYQYKHNTKEYRLTYFGEEKDYTFHGGIGGALIKERAARAFRYIRDNPGTLRATIEND